MILKSGFAERLHMGSWTYLRNLPSQKSAPQINVKMLCFCFNSEHRRVP